MWLSVVVEIRRFCCAARPAALPFLLLLETLRGRHFSHYFAEEKQECVCISRRAKRSAILASPTHMRKETIFSLFFPYFLPSIVAPLRLGNPKEFVRVRSNRSYPVHFILFLLCVAPSSSVNPQSCGTGERSELVSFGRENRHLSQIRRILSECERSLSVTQRRKQI